MITVIEQSTSERKAETKELFEQCQPYLDKGWSLNKAVTEATNRKPTNSKNGWYRDLIEYAASQGYDHYKLKWQRGEPL